MRIAHAIALIAMFASYTSGARDQIRETPAIGKITTAAIGGTLWEQYRYEGVPGVIIEGPVQANWGSLEYVSLPAGSGLVILRDRRLKACRGLTTYQTFGGSTWSDCLFDTDDDGKFDRVSYTSSGFSKAVDPPVTYRREIIEMVGDGPHNFRKVLLYLGSDGTALKLSYREFANGMARPAFTEEFNIPLGPAFPQDIAVKDRVITILGIDGMGLRYQVLR